MIYYICNYADYTDLPAKLFCDNSPVGTERKSLDDLKFVARCKDHKAGEGCLSWMIGNEVELNHSEIIQEMVNSEWTTEEI